MLAEQGLTADAVELLTKPESSSKLGFPVCRSRHAKRDALRAAFRVARLKPSRSSRSSPAGWPVVLRIQLRSQSGVTVIRKNNCHRC